MSIKLVGEKSVQGKGKMDVERRVITKIIENERKNLRSMMSENRKIKGGNVKKRKKGNKYYYTEYYRGKERGITKNKERIQLLYRKKYLKSSIRKSKVVIKYLDKLLEELDKITVDKDCLCLGTYSIENWHWMEAEYATNPMHPEALRYKTTLGTMVRSKSELNIANTLERLGVPYRYEQKTYIDNRFVYPDFTILLPDGNSLIWEHNGLMEDEQYANRSRTKTQEYEAAGFRQHKNLIITYEDDIRTPKQIEAIIGRYYIF